MKRITLAITLTLLAIAGSAAADAWAVDPSHSHVGFSVRHMMVSNVKGEFSKFEGSAEIDDKNLTKSTVQFTIEASSVNTRDAKRDEHLRSPDFFDASKHPKITFVSTDIKKAGKGYKVSGDLTIRGVTKKVTLEATITKPINTPFGTTARGVSISGTVHRKDFDITWNKAIDAGGVVLGEDVEIDIELELMKK